MSIYDKLNKYVPTIGVEAACKKLGVSTSTYYYHKAKAYREGSNKPKVIVYEGKNTKKPVTKASPMMFTPRQVTALLLAVANG